MTTVVPPDLFGTDPRKPRPGRFDFIKRPWFIISCAFVIFLVVVGLSINRIMETLLHSRPEVVVPKIEGKNLMDAIQAVSALGLSLQQEGTDFDESLPAGTILRQSPPSGMEVRAGRAIRIVVSKGGQVVFVPEIDGKAIAEAQSLLAAQGMQMGAVTESFSTDVAKGVVMTQAPSSGTVATRGALVDVTISKGAPPVGVPLMPDFSGKTADDVRGWATGVSATVKVTEDPKAMGPAGTVVRQTPAPGQPLLDGEQVEVVLAPASGGQSRLTFKVPDGIGECTVRVMARDDKGENQVYQGRHTGGQTIDLPVAVNTTTRFRFYVDDVLKDERVVEP